MFLRHLLTFEDRQKLLKLSGWKLIEDSPKYLESSKMVCLVRHVRTKFGAREQLQDILFPRIRAQTVLRLYRNLRRGQRGVLLDQLSTLFHLGLGVPKHKQIAEFILLLDQADDQKVAIKYIGKLIKQYIANYKFSTDDHEYMYCAQYTEQLMLMKKFITREATGKTKAMRVPEGIPTVMVYSLLDYHGSKFSLVDGYSFSKSGFPIPISASVLRKEFDGAPRQFSNISLKTHGQYVLVFGVLYWPDGSEENFKHMQTLDTDDYEVLIDQYDKYCSKEILDARKYKNVDKEIHAEHRRVLSVEVQKESPTKKERRLIREAQTYFDERENALKKLGRLERKAAIALEKSGPVSSAKFFALDIGTIGQSQKLRMVVSSLPEDLAKSLKSFGFTTRFNADTQLSSKIIYGVKGKRRSWQIDLEK